MYALSDINFPFNNASNVWFCAFLAFCNQLDKRRIFSTYKIKHSFLLIILYRRKCASIGLTLEHAHKKSRQHHLINPNGKNNANCVNFSSIYFTYEFFFHLYKHTYTNFNAMNKWKSIVNCSLFFFVSINIYSSLMSSFIYDLYAHTHTTFIMLFSLGWKLWQGIFLEKSIHIKIIIRERKLPLAHFLLWTVLCVCIAIFFKHYAYTERIVLLLLFQLYP